MGEISKIKFKASQEKKRWNEELKQPKNQKKNKRKLIEQIMKKRDELRSQLIISKLHKKADAFSIDHITKEIKNLEASQKNKTIKPKAPTDKWAVLKDQGYIGRMCDVIACKNKDIASYASYLCRSMMLGHITIGQCEAATRLDRAKVMLLGHDEIKERRFPSSLPETRIKWLVNELVPNPNVRIRRSDFEKLVMRSSLRSIILADTKADAIKYKQKTQTECLIVAMDESEILAMFRNGPKAKIPSFDKIKVRFGVTTDNADTIQNDITILQKCLDNVKKITVWQNDIKEYETREIEIQKKITILNKRVSECESMLKKRKITEEDMMSFNKRAREVDLQMQNGE